jgi:hypothetical protein
MIRDVIWEDGRPLNAIADQAGVLPQLLYQFAHGQNKTINSRDLGRLMDVLGIKVRKPRRDRISAVA